MSAHRIEAIVNQDGKLVLENLPFQAGDVVEVIVSKSEATSNGDNRHSLEGTVTKYEAPLEPVGLEDWDSLT
jgi:hypothetical protein